MTLWWLREHSSGSSIVGKLAAWGQQWSITVVWNHSGPKTLDVDLLESSSYLSSSASCFSGCYFVILTGTYLHLSFFNPRGTQNLKGTTGVKRKKTVKEHVCRVYSKVLLLFLETHKDLFPPFALQVLPSVCYFPAIRSMNLLLCLHYCTQGNPSSLVTVGFHFPQSFCPSAPPHKLSSFLGKRCDPLGKEQTAHFPTNVPPERTHSHGHFVAPY